MIPAGYMYKNVAEKPEWLKADSVIDIFSLSGCISKDFCDYVEFWKHNGYWLFDSVQVMEELAKTENVDISSCKLFYYEVYEKQYDDEKGKWCLFEPEKSFITNAMIPADKKLEGFDVVSFSCGNAPGCSPLSCNGLAKETEVNRHCLIESFKEAKRLVESGFFHNSEPGPFRIFAIYSMPAVV